MAGDDEGAGQAPAEQIDYRFLLANERTFLAWMRTGGTLTDGGAPIKHYANSAT